MGPSGKLIDVSLLIFLLLAVQRGRWCFLFGGLTVLLTPCLCAPLYVNVVNSQRISFFELWCPAQCSVHSKPITCFQTPLWINCSRFDYDISISVIQIVTWGVFWFFKSPSFNIITEFLSTLPVTFYVAQKTAKTFICKTNYLLTLPNPPPIQETSMALLQVIV